MVSPPFTSNFFTTTSGTRTHYLRSGDSSGTLVICLHGLGGSVNTFTTLAKSLSPAYDTVLVDFQGFGKTALKSTSEPLSLQKHVSDLHDLVSFLQGDGNGVAQGRKVVLIGHSLGTIVALHYTAQHSEVAGLALLGTGRSASHIPAARQRMLDVAANTRSQGIDFTAKNSSIGNFPSPDQRAAPPEHIKEVYDAVAASDPEGYAKTCEMIMDLDHKDPDYSRVTCPVMLIAGDLDVISPVQRSQDVASLVAGPNWVEIVESGHQPLISAFKPSVAAIQNLLAQI